MSVQKITETYDIFSCNKLLPLSRSSGVFDNIHKSTKAAVASRQAEESVRLFLLSYFCGD